MKKSGFLALLLTAWTTNRFQITIYLFTLREEG